MIKYTECVKDRLLDGSVRVLPEMFIYCIDSKDAFYYTKESKCIVYTKSFLRFSTKKLFDNANGLEKGKIYGVGDTKGLYNFERYKLELEEELLDADFTAKLEGGTLYDNGEGIAPVTLGTSVYHMGTELESALKNAKEQIFYKIQVTNSYVEVVENDQRLFEIPFPFLNYTLGMNQMQITLNNVVINNKFTILGRMIKLNDDIEKNYLKKGDVLLFTFMYNTAITLNDFIISTSNIEDGSITDIKLSNDIKIPGENVLESDNKQLVSSNEKLTWNSKANNTLASETKNGLISAAKYKMLMNHETQLSNLPLIKTGSSVVTKSNLSYTLNDADIDESSFVIVSCNRTDYTATVVWSYGSMVITLNKTATQDVKVNWIIFSPKN